MEEIKGTNIIGAITPFTTDDTYPTHYAKYGHGGYRTVETIEKMNSIPTARREDGMLVYVKAEDKIYKYNGTDFSVLDLGGSHMLPAEVYATLRLSSGVPEGITTVGFDDIKTPGVYFAGSGYNQAPGMLGVISLTSENNYIMQKYSSFLYPDYYFVRSYVDGSWSEWTCTNESSAGTVYNAGANINIDRTDNTISAEGYVFYGVSNSFAEGLKDTNAAPGANSHAEGLGTAANGNYSHTEGNDTIASGIASHAEGSGSTASGHYSHSEGADTAADGDYSHVEGSGSIGIGVCSHAEGCYTRTEGESSHAEGFGSYTSGYASHAEGSNTTAEGVASHTEGYNTHAESYAAHAEGSDTTASGVASHAEGSGSIGIGEFSHAEGSGTIGIGRCSHAEGIGSYASGDYSHTEGSYTQTGASGAHAEGGSTVASGICSHAEGSGTKAAGTSSHAEGEGTIANNTAEHVEGRYNMSHSNTISSIGIGTAENSRCNALEVINNGDLYIKGIGDYVGGTNGDPHEMENVLSLQNIISNIQEGVGSVAESQITYNGSNNISVNNGVISAKGYSYDIETEALTVPGTIKLLSNEYDSWIRMNFADFAANSISFAIDSSTIDLSNTQIVSDSNITTSGSISAEQGFYERSDIRKKNVIDELPLDKAYELINNCQSIIYTLKDNTDKQQIGLIAQEIQQYFPEVVSEDKDGYLSLDYAKLTSVIFRVLKDVIDRLSKLENK